MISSLKEWRVHKTDQPSLLKLTKHFNISPLLARLLLNRNLHSIDQIDSFLFHSLKNLPSPFLLKGMEKAVDRIIKAINKKEKIVVYGDYDVDGTTATSLLVLFFKDIGYPVDYYIPHRLREGYSLNNTALVQLKNEGVKVVITVDNGISARDAALKARELEIDLLITDHHEVPDVLPNAFSIINPLQKGCAYPDKMICGCGVAFNLALALRKGLRDAGYFHSRRAEPNMKQYLDLVAMATVADVVPLMGVNRIFVKQGLREIETSPRLGLKALKEVSGIDGPVRASHLGFRLGPRINACGRLYDARAGVQLLTSNNALEASRLARDLDLANRERQDLEQTILEQAIIQVENNLLNSKPMSLVVYDSSWHPGVVGIVASRLVSRYNRPVIVLGLDKDGLKGSGRSFGGLDMGGALRECESSLTRYGGHKGAVGVSLKEENLPRFIKQFEKSVRGKISEHDCQPYLPIDDELSLADIHLKLVEELSLIAPFGQGNPEPLFCLKGIEPAYARIVGNNHLKFDLGDEQTRHSAIAFGMGKDLPKLEGKVDLAFTLETNHFQGKKSVDLFVKDIKQVEKRAN